MVLLAEVACGGRHDRPLADDELASLSQGLPRVVFADELERLRDGLSGGRRAGALASTGDAGGAAFSPFTGPAGLAAGCHVTSGREELVDASGQGAGGKAGG